MYFVLFCRIFKVNWVATIKNKKISVSSVNIKINPTVSKDINHNTELAPITIKKNHVSLVISVCASKNKIKLNKIKKIQII